MRSKLILTLFVSVLVAIGLVGYTGAADYYVDAKNGSNENSGGSGDPWLTITWALDHVSGGAADPVSIHVAAGTYATITNGETFPLVMESWVSLVGAAPETTMLDAENLAYHVIYCDSVNNLSIEGLTVTRGNANGEYNTPDWYGGGIYCNNAAGISIIDCAITNNNALGIGGGLRCYASSLTMANCTISNNTAADSAGAICGSNSSPTIINCMITGNSSNWAGAIWWWESDAITTNCEISGNTFKEAGAIDCHWCSPTFEDCTIADNHNTAGWYGGAIFLYKSSPTITNCAITGNTATGTYGAGGAIYCHSQSRPTIANCTFSDNIATNTGAIYCGSGCRITVINSILWGDTPNEIDVGDKGASAPVTYSCIEGGWSGTGNISIDPLFATGPLGGYYLGSGSPCINAGSMSAEAAGLADRTTQADGTTLDTGTVDMGYHYEATGGNSPPTAEIVSITPSPATEGQEVHFLGSGTDSDGTVAAYEWRSDIDGSLSDLAEFYTSALSSGTHTISFKVQDNDGAWSQADTETLVIEGGGENNPPTAVIDSITPNPAYRPKDKVKFSGHGTDTDGTVVAYEWTSSIDGFLSNQSSFTKPTRQLSLGLHTIYFKVQDDDGAWSTPVTRDLEIK